MVLVDGVVAVHRVIPQPVPEVVDDVRLPDPVGSDGALADPDDVLARDLLRGRAFAQYETLSGMSAVPMTYLIVRDGKVVDAWYDYRQGRAEKLLKQLGF